MGVINSKEQRKLDIDNKDNSSEKTKVESKITPKITAEDIQSNNFESKLSLLFIVFRFKSS